MSDSAIDSAGYKRSPSWLGSKDASGAYQVIVAQMPPHDTYIETHLGGGAVLRHKPPAGRSIAIDRDPRALTRFRRVPRLELVQSDCLAFLNAFDFAAAGRVLIYADPPYVHATRTSRRRYRFEYSDADHVQLIEVLRRVPAAVLLSGYPSPLYDRLLADWRTIEFQVMTRGGPRTEKLWMNFAPKAAHWATFAGRNFTDRQRIKRKAARWAANFRRLSAGERTAILAALLDLA